jgi:hypothetical protein
VKKVAKGLFTVACIISSLVGIWHFSAPYASQWYSYIPDAPTEIYQSINYINFCFSFFLAGLSLLLLAVQKKLFEGSKELRAFHAFFALVWFSRVIIQLVWPWPSALQLWLVVAFSTEFLLTLIPLIYLLRNAPKQEATA